MSEKIKLAIQKSGRLSNDSLKLIQECGINVNNGKGKLTSIAGNFPMEFLFLRDDDIPGYVADGVADLGIVGKNVLLEKGKNIDVVKNLGFSKCRLSLAIPKEKEYTGIKYFDRVSIATSYPKILQEFLDKNNLTADIHEISGSVEIAPNIGLADAICDLVSSGSTLFTNGLKEVEVLMHSEAVLVGSPNMNAAKKEILERLLFRINAVQTGEKNRYILLNAPNDSLDKIISIIPGMKSPTVLPLAIEGWSSVHSVIGEGEFWEVIENLRAEGAQGILVVPIEKMVI
ncbi:ATP phosphoribosyltransferase [Fulvivirgaceae bacterium BMA12]|uniref:ATP phosphoribosyltransferase n=1 Tax=Agaribacillus aureus TaxID=3051825 RepID=A0ABT8L3U5_9BACT|nr:ATP phosphoribosyltransferase [Fulvivirgaceae bacterium BMA12]